MKRLKEIIAFADITTLQGILTNAKSFMDLRDPLKKAGFKVDFSTSPIPYYTAQKSGKKLAIMNKKYADKAILTVKDIAVEEM